MLACIAEKSPRFSRRPAKDGEIENENDDGDEKDCCRHRAMLKGREAVCLGVACGAFVCERDKL
jgi:hypothetical protein